MNNSIPNTKIIIRPAILEDCETIVEFNCLMAIETEEKRLPRETVRDGVESVLRNPQQGRYFVALMDDRIVGQMMQTWEFSDWRNGHFWWIQSVYVLPEARRSGIFRQLYRHLKSLAEDDSQVVGLRLYVEHENKQAQQTYKNMGMTDSHYIVMEEMI